MTKQLSPGELLALRSKRFDYSHKMERINITIGPEKRPCEFENFKQNPILPDDYEIKGEVLELKLRNARVAVEHTKAERHICMCCCA